MTGPENPPSNALTGSSTDGPAPDHTPEYVAPPHLTPEDALQQAKDYADSIAAGGGGGPITSNLIVDATSVGTALLTAPDAPTARTTINAEVAGAAATAESNAKTYVDNKPDLVVTSALITDATSAGKAVLTAATNAAARTAIGAETAGAAATAETNAKAYVDSKPDPVVTANTISDATTVGKSVLTAANAAAARTTLSAEVSGAAATAETNAKAYVDSKPDPVVTANTISDATSTGKAVLTAASAAAARTAIGAGTSSFDGAYASLSGKPVIPNIILLGPADAVPAGTPQDTIIVRRAS